jgi:hypothetical protein
MASVKRPGLVPLSGEQSLLGRLVIGLVACLRGRNGSSRSQG